MCRIELHRCSLRASILMAAVICNGSTFTGWSQETQNTDSNTTESILKEAMERAEEGDLSHLAGRHSNFHDQFRTAESLELLNPYLRNDSYSVRFAAFSLLSAVGRGSGDPHHRRLVVSKLAGEIRPDSTETYLMPLKRLINGFRESDFDEDARKLLLEKLKDWEIIDSGPQGPTAERLAVDFPDLDEAEIARLVEAIKAAEQEYRNQYTRGLETATPELIELIGIAGLREALFVLDIVESGEARRMGGDPLRSAEPPFWMTKTFKCLATRARLGDKEAIKRMLDRCNELESEKERGSVVHTLAFTKTPEAIEYIRSVLFSTLPREKARPGSDAIPPGPPSESAAWALYNMIEGFPNPDRVDMDACRAYMDARPPGSDWTLKR